MNERLTRRRPNATLRPVKVKAKNPSTPKEKKTPGTLLAEQMRAEGNKLTDAERERLGEEFMKLYFR